jgi:hypothetical protein
MSRENVDGISVGGTDEGRLDELSEIEQLVEELEVDDLNELSDAQITQLLDMMDETARVRGIETDVDEPDISGQEARIAARNMAQQERQSALQEQLEELKNIQDNTTLLQRIVAEISSLNQSIENTNGLLVEVVNANVRGPALKIKDSGLNEFSRVNTKRDVVDDDDITTSIVLIKANANNKGSIFVGSDTVSVRNGLEIEAGERFPFRIDVLSHEFKAVAEEEGDEYSYIAFGLGSD